MKLTTHLLLRFLLPVALGAVLLLGLSLGILWGFREQWTDSTSDELVTIESQTLRTRADNRALFVDNFFSQVSNDMVLLRDYTNLVFNGSLGSVVNQYMTHNSLAQPTLPLTTNRGLTNTYVGTQGWYVHPAMTGLVTQPDLNMIQILDNVHRPLYSSNPAFALSYVGFASNRVWATHPFTPLTDLPTLQIQCPPPNGPSQIGFDPTCRGWYDTAQQIENRGRVVFTPPYIDAVSGLVTLTASLAIENNMGGLIGVAGVDLQLQNIDDTVQSSPVLENGYTFVIDGEGQIVSHPDANRDNVEDLVDVEFSNPQDRTAFMPLLNQMRDGIPQTENLQTYIKNGQTWVISFSHLNSTGDSNGDGKFTLALVAPESDLTAPVDEVDSTVDDSLGAMSAVLVFLVLTCLGIMLFSSYYISKRILGPVFELQTLVKKMTDHNLDIELQEEEPVARELTAIYSNFRDLLTAIRFGNNVYHQGDMQKALFSYESALTMMQRLKNERGIAVCYNNLGNTYFRLNRLKDAEEAYGVAISMSNQRIESKDATFEEIHREKINLANRKMNLGLVKQYQRQFKEARKMFKSAIVEHRELENSLGYAKAVDNMGQLLIAQGRWAKAKESFDEALRAVKDIGAEDEQTKFATQFIHASLGNYYLKRFEAVQTTTPGPMFNEPPPDQMPRLAAGHYTAALTTGAKIDKQVMVTALTQLRQSYLLQGRKDLAEKVPLEEHATEMATGPASRDIHFVIDYSGSMYGSRIREVRESIRSIVDTELNDDDCVALTLFSTSVRPVVPISNLGENRQKILNEVNNLTRPNGATRFYGAVRAAAEVKWRKSSRAYWIIALTDGEDNSSLANDYSKAMQALTAFTNAKEPVHLLVITVGTLNNLGRIDSMAKCTKFGKVIQAGQESGAIASAFKKVVQMMHNLNVEEL